MQQDLINETSTLCLVQPYLPIPVLLKTSVWLSQKQAKILSINNIFTPETLKVKMCRISACSRLLAVAKQNNNKKNVLEIILGPSHLSFRDKGS